MSPVPRPARQAHPANGHAVLPRVAYGSCPRCPALTDERFLQPHDAELVSLRVGENGPGLGAGLPDVDRARPERQKTVNLLITIRGAAGEVEVHTVLNRFWIGDGHEADADGCVLVSPDDDLALALGKDLPAERTRPEPGQPRQVVRVNDDVLKSDRHADSMRGTPAERLNWDGSMPFGAFLALCARTKARSRLRTGE